jgi:hypothetical protein
MSEIATIIPVCLQVPRIFDQFRENLRTLKSSPISRLIVICNRLTLMTPETLHAFLSTDVPFPIEVIADMERSVAGAWNKGIEIALARGHETFLVTAVDVAFRNDTVSRLEEFGRAQEEALLWSSRANDSPMPESIKSIDACDFSCFMLRKRTVEKVGWFDKEFKPAYFEDNDYVTRVVLHGVRPQCVIAARHIHQGSLTVKLDPEMAHHVKYWFESNRLRFLMKWRAQTDVYADIPRECFSTPFNSGNSLSWWPEQDRESYSPSGGIHA